MLGLGVILTVSGVGQRMAVASPPVAVQQYTGQVESIRVDHCGSQDGACSGSLVLAQARGQEVALAIPSGTSIQRGDQRVHLEDLGIGNYVTVRAMPLPSERVEHGSTRVGSSVGEQPFTYQDATEEND